jgi:hypothetical protein
MHKNHCVYEKASKILTDYFMVDNEDNQGENLLKVIQGESTGFSF